MKKYQVFLIALFAASAHAFPTWSQSDDDYVKISIETEQALKKNIADYKKLIAEHTRVKTLYSELIATHKEILDNLQQTQMDASKLRQTLNQAQIEIISLNAKAEQTVSTIENLKKALYYCRSEVGKMKRRVSRRSKKLGLNGKNSSLSK